MLYASDVQTICEISSEIKEKISPVSYHPSYAPNIELYEFLNTIKQKYGNKVALVLAHPASELSLPKNLGILNYIKGKVSFDEITFIFDYVQGVGCFNASLPCLERLRFSKKDNDFTFLKKIMEDSKERVGIVPTLNAINLAFALYCRKEYGLFGSFEADSHVYQDIFRKKPKIDSLGVGRTVFRGIKSFSSKSFVEAMHRAKEQNLKNQNLSDDSIYADVFYKPLRPSKGMPVSERSKTSNSLHLNLFSGIAVIISVFGHLKISYSNQLSEYLYVIRKSIGPAERLELVRQKASNFFWMVVYSLKRFISLFKKESALPNQ
ncbi:MAG: hypothetical protein QW035_00460 [Candidatus Anstonellales archaeon]